MADSNTVQPSIREFFSGKSILLTGSTGFLAKAVVEKLLRDVPEIGQIYLLIRPRVKADGSRVDPRERIKDEILRSTAFRRLREELGDKFESFCESKITCVGGDLSKSRLGMDQEVFDGLAKKLHIVVNSAATVVFDERLDTALELNTLGPRRLLELAKAAGAVYVHISTAYVSGKRTGLVPEKLLNPLDAIDAQLPPGVPRPQKFDVNDEVTRLGELAAGVKTDCERLFVQKGLAAESEQATEQLRTALVGVGMRRAQSLGWNDTYTYTKFLGEQIVKLDHGTVPTVIVRPSIIESSLREPEPGWLDGLRMADPIIIGFGKGRLADFPANQNVVLDIIPADLVVNTVLAAARHVSNRALNEKWNGEAPFDLFTIASSSENPLLFRSLYEHVRTYFQKHPMTDRSGKPVIVPSWRFPTIEQYTRRMQNRYLMPIRAASAVLNGPISIPGTRKFRSRLRTLNTTLEQLLYYVNIYGPYVNLQCRFETSHTRELLESLTPEDREKFSFDPRQIRWRNYLQDVHIPGLKRNILRMEEAPRAGAGDGHLLDEEGAAARRRAGSSNARGVPQTIAELCARGKERFGNKSLVEIRRATADKPSETAPTRITYAEMYDRSGVLARRLTATLGLKPRDRVALMGENSPEWALAYMAVSRACCTVVPLDRQLPPDDAARLIAIVEAKALICSPPVRETLGQSVKLPPCLNMLDPQFAPHPGERLPFPEATLEEGAIREPSPEMLASIIFTSGTTHDPKGVMLSHSNLVADALSVAEVLEPMEADRFLSVLPLHHALEFTGGFLIPMYGGSTIHHVESMKDISSTMQLAGISVVIGVPRLFKLMMDRIQQKLESRGTSTRIRVSLGRTMAAAGELVGKTEMRKNLFKEIHASLGGNLRLFVSGGASLDPRIFDFFKSFGIKIVEGYGLTETSPVMTVNPLAAPKGGSVGPEVPGVEVRIHAPDNAGIGEILARGPTVMQGYWLNPQATEKAFINGWFRSGDLGRFDSGGYLHITGRVKEVIVTASGKNVYPDEVEAALHDIPGVRELCVLGLPARSGQGEEVAVIVVPENLEIKEQIRAAIERINQTLPSTRRVSRTEFQLDDLPKTTTLKVQRNKLRQRYEGGKAGESEVPRTGKGTPKVLSEISDGGDFVEIARAVSRASETKFSPADISPEMKLEMDLGMDSIARTGLLQELELQLGISIPNDTDKLFTVRDVMNVVESARKGSAGKVKKPARSILDIGRSATNGIEEGMRRSVSKSVLQVVFGATTKMLMNTYLSIECHGLENIPNGPYIIAANHCSHLDSIAIREVLGKRAAELHVMGAKDYFFNTRTKAWFFSTFINALPFDREDNIAASLGNCKQVLDAGRAILIFPEGTRSLSGELQPFRSGIGVLSVELDVPVIPVYLRGTFEALPKGKSIPRRGRIEVRIGRPADLSALKREKAAGNLTELYRRAASELRARVEGLMNLPDA